MFCGAAFVLGSIGQEFRRGVRARRAMSNASPPVALVALVRRNRRRYGGYIVHLGIAVLFVGVAASSAFQHAQDVRLRPGQTVDVGGYRMTYVRPTAAVDRDPKSTGAILDLGAVIDISQHGRHVTTLAPSAGYYPDQSGSTGAVSGLIGGQAVSHVGLSASLRRDLWSAVQPNMAALQPLIAKANMLVPPAAAPKVRAVVAFTLLGAIAQRYRQHPPAAQFRFIVSPMVTWIWLGGLIVFGGGMIALWPAPAAVRGRVRAGYLARVGQELGRA
jgi:cytochrome c-type biogenesis protein CcmF